MRLRKLEEALKEAHRQSMVHKHKLVIKRELEQEQVRAIWAEPAAQEWQRDEVGAVVARELFDWSWCEAPKE